MYYLCFSSFNACNFHFMQASKNYADDLHVPEIVPYVQ